MLKALIYKEWLKIRWAALITLAVFLLVLVKMTLYMSYTIRIVGANSFWNDVFIRGLLYFDDLLYIPVVTGIVIAAFQFFPEITENRLKLTLHLPMRENSILMHMAIMGASVVLSITALSYLVLCIITVFYFPSLVLTSILLTTAPWLIAGLVSYFSTITIFVEPIWFKRVFFLGVSFMFVSGLLDPVKFNVFTNALVPFLVLSMFFSISVLFSGHRFRKGVLK